MENIPRDTIERASNGDIGAFEEIYTSYSGFVYNVALRIVNNTSDAEEVTQDVFMKIYKSLRNFRFESSFKTWVYRITANTAINTYKKISKESKHRGDYDIALKTHAADDKTEECFKKEENEKLLGYLLDKLSIKQRSCIVLREVEGLSYEEISKVLGININTVRSRIKRARLALLAYGKEVVGYEL
ncbi:MAG: hypothetical protein B1H08_06695 [Candidatus Omnitrophica bacterium 4484_171]|nr:MAG: hypothetical protein B1H08_06695 [Candidatus Omnitrophica bacterium 4484_171]